jgi:DNA-binding response OmpR family regulator
VASFATLDTPQLAAEDAGRVTFRAGRRLDLTHKELAVLECLLAACGKPASAEVLIKKVWDDDLGPFTTTVKTTIRRLPRQTR